MAVRNMDSIDSGSNYNFGDKRIPPNFPRSMFDLSHLHTTTLHSEGALIPVAVIPTLPNDSFELSVRSLLRVLPQVVPLYSRQRLYVHAYYSRNGDLWKNFNTFMTKGYTGNQILNIPTVKVAADGPSWNDSIAEAYSLSGYFGLPFGMLGGAAKAAKVSALPYMMYLRIWRDYFCNRNLFLNNRSLLPNDDADFRLDDDGQIISYKAALFPDSPLLANMLYRNFPDDYFTSGLPFPQRGDVPTLNLNVGGAAPLVGNGSTDIALALSSFNFPSLGQTVLVGDSSTVLPSNNYGIRSDNATPIVPGQNLGITGLNVTEYIKNNMSVDLSGVTGLGFTLAQLRELSAKQQELERMARTDGSYRQFGLTFYGRPSKTSQDYSPVFIGGTFQEIAYTEVLQTSASASTPLGTYGGHGISYTKDGYIGKIDCDDYGYIMIIASVMPDVYYSQGVDRHWTNNLQSDFYLPTRSKLGMRAILNKELFFAGNPVQDDDVWAYQDPFDEFRYMQNRISGKIADSSSLSFFPYTQSRLFSVLPNYNSEFYTTKDNVRHDYLFAPNEVPFTAQFSFNIRAVRQLPYRAIPQEIVHGGNI